MPRDESKTQSALLENLRPRSRSMRRSTLSMRYFAVIFTARRFADLERLPTTTREIGSKAVLLWSSALMVLSKSLISARRPSFHYGRSLAAHHPRLPWYDEAKEQERLPSKS